MTIRHMEEGQRPFIVCPGCKGHGTRANPAFDGMAVSADSFDGDYEEMRDFMSEYTRRGGMYDVSCFDCNGARVVRAECECSECEEGRADLAQMYAEMRAEQAMGC